jgi:radical SAM superfamily enzyme YgiQ (UPF0313 family)
MVFVGIESPNLESLTECGKTQNSTRDLVSAVNKLQRSGLEVTGGFIVGFDSDPQSIFQDIINFVQKSGVVTAMVGLLHAPTGTRLWKRLNEEKRLTGGWSGNNTDMSINFTPRMNLAGLKEGYRKIVTTIYSPRQYYERVKTFLNEYRPQPQKVVLPKLKHYIALIKTFWALGIKEKGQYYFWKLVFWTALKRPRSFPAAIEMSIFGLHFRRVAEHYARQLRLTPSPGSPA